MILDVNPQFGPSTPCNVKNGSVIPIFFKFEQWQRVMGLKPALIHGK
jgi:hypothetical protein